MTIRCECDHCGASLKVKDKLAGTEGNCPKCHEKISIPNTPSDDSEDMLLGDAEAKTKPTAPKRTVEEEEEDAIFGDDFFSLQEPEPRSRYVPPVANDDDDDNEPAPRKMPQPKSSKAEISVETDSGSGSNAASIASSLLSKTGKRNRPEDFKDPSAPEEVSYDFSEIKYFILQRILPAAGAALVVFSMAYWMFSDMMDSGPELPGLAELTGRVTNNGEGTGAQLIFLPIAGTGKNGGGSGSSSVAIADPDGTYEAFYKDDIKGLIVGKHEVRINAGAVRVTREIIVEAGSQVIDFELAE